MNTMMSQKTSLLSGLGFSLMVSLLGLGSCQKHEIDLAPMVTEEKVTVAGHKLQTRLAGMGSPTVVLLSGAESPLTLWRQVQDGAAAKTRVLAYDRAGYGQSDPVTGPRDGETVVAELRQLLTQKGIKAPYVLVAHSLGGPFAQLCAARYKSEVKGVVLVDCPSDEELEFTGQLPEDLFDQVFGGLTYSGTRGELKAIGQTMRQIQSRQGLPDVPLIVITNTRPEEGETPADKQLDWEAQAQWLRGKSKAQQWRTDKGHMVPQAEPSLIIRAIQELSR